MTQKDAIREFEKLGYTRKPYSRNPAQLVLGVITHSVYPDGSIETYVNGRLVVGKR